MSPPDELPVAMPYARETARRLRANPRGPDALFVSAAILAALERHAEALAFLDRLAKASPHYPGLWRFKARLHTEVGDPRMAALCERAAERDSSST